MGSWRPGVGERATAKDPGGGSLKETINTCGMRRVEVETRLGWGSPGEGESWNGDDWGKGRT